MSFQIAIDGPAGAGKSTIARKVAEELGFLYIDTGAMYRAMGLYALDRGIDPADVDAVNEALPGIDVDLTAEDGALRVLLQGEDVSERIRTEEVSMAASKISAHRAVREKLVHRQQEIAGVRDVVMDGRDIGTVVLTEAPLKVFLTASAKTRANRRVLDLIGRGESPDPEEVLRDIVARDQQDMNRAESPLRQAKDAVFLDSSNLSIDEVTSRILELVRERRGH